MQSTPDEHNDVVRREFTRQAAAYAANPSVADRGRVERLVDAVAPAREARVLDVATGPGYVALGFAAVCHEVVGLDLTAAPLAIAEEMRREHGVTDLRFMVGDAANLPFESGSFDVVVCRLALHHVTNPERVVTEMARVCRAGGTVAVDDLIASEHAERAAYQNNVETLRDPSHVRALALSELMRLYAAAGLEVRRIYSEPTEQNVERWLANAQTPPGPAQEVRALIEQDAACDLSGMAPFRRDGALWFTHLSAVVIGRVLAGAAPGPQPQSPLS